MGLLDRRIGKPVRETSVSARDGLFVCKLLDDQAKIMKKFNLKSWDAIGVLCFLWIGVQLLNGRSGFISIPANGGNDGQWLGANILAIVCYAGAVWFIYRLIKKSKENK